MGRPLPIKDGLTEPFWEAARRGVLMVQREPSTGRLRWPPRSRGVPEWTEELEWVPHSGRATLYTFSVVNRSSHTYMETPYVLAIVELEGGVHMVTNLVDVAPEDVEIGMPLEVAWEPLETGDRLPVFRPATAGRRAGRG